MTSHSENIPKILQAIDGVNPKRILDIGVGFGKFGLLAREQYLSKKKEIELIPINDIIIDCCEITEYFINLPYHNSLYDHHFHQSFFELKDKLKDVQYDLILMIDVVEHYPKDEVKKWLREILQNKNKILISTPKEVVMYTQHYYGDPNHHKSQWTREDFNEFKNTDYSTDFSHIFLLG